MLSNLKKAKNEMATGTERGQVLIETVLSFLIFVVILHGTYSLVATVTQEASKHQFTHERAIKKQGRFYE